MFAKCLRCGKLLFEQVPSHEGAPTLLLMPRVQYEIKDGKNIFTCPHCSARNVGLDGISTSEGDPAVIISHWEE